MIIKSHPIISASCIVVVIALLWSWKSPDPRISVKKGPLNVTVYTDGEPKEAGSLKKGSAGLDAIHLLLEQKKGHWKRSFITYAPNLYLKNEDFNVNFCDDVVIVNS